MNAQLLIADGDSFGAVAARAVLSGLPVARQRLGVATGATPVHLYAELARLSDCGDIDLSGATLLALDEYVGLGRADPRSYAAYVHDTIAAPLGIDAANVLIPDGLAQDLDREAAAIEAQIAAIGGVDVQIAGIGANGHLAFNEPGSPFDSVTRTVTLSIQTRRDNAAFFDGCLTAVPARAITQGLATISRARSIVLLARGTRKAPALRAALRGPVTTAVPASILQRHSHLTVVADRDAAAML